MQTCVLLSIRPQFVEQIFKGNKRFEFRRVLFKDRDVKRIVVYATAPVSKVVGEFEIDDIIEDEIVNLWEKTKDHSGITEEYFNKYFVGKENGYAIKIGKYLEYYEHRELDKDLNIRYVPQSFVYLRCEPIKIPVLPYVAVL